MNRRLLLVFLFTGILFFQFGCDFADFTRGSKKILSHPPYASLTDSIEQFPDDANLYLQRATLLSQNNKHDLAHNDYKKAWELRPDEDVAMRYISNLLLINKVRNAVSLLQECIDRYPNNSEFRRILGEVYAQMNNRDKALAQYDSILRYDSLNFEAWYDKGMLLMDLKDTTEAIVALEKAFQIMPINHTGYPLFELYTAQNNPRALEISDILIANDSSGQQVDPILWKGIFYSETENYAKALEQFEECIKRDWKKTEAHLEKGIALYELQRYQDALKAFTLAATVSNTDPDAYFWLGRCYEALGERDKAIANYERALSLERNFTEAMEALKRLSS